MSPRCFAIKRNSWFYKELLFRYLLNSKQFPFFVVLIHRGGFLVNYMTCKLVMIVLGEGKHLIQLGQLEPLL